MIRPNRQSKVTYTSQGAKIQIDKYNGDAYFNVCFGFPGSASASDYLTVPKTTKSVKMTNYPYIVLDMKVVSANASSVQFQSIYVNSGTRWQGTNNNFAGFNNAFSNDNAFHKYVIDTSSNSYISGQLNTIRIGYLMPLNGFTISNGDYIILRSIKFAQTSAEATALAAN